MAVLPQMTTSTMHSGRAPTAWHRSWAKALTADSRLAQCLSIGAALGCRVDPADQVCAPGRLRVFDAQARHAFTSSRLIRKAAALVVPRSTASPSAGLPAGARSMTSRPRSRILSVHWSSRSLARKSAETFLAAVRSTERPGSPAARSTRSTSLMLSTSVAGGTRYVTASDIGVRAEPHKGPAGVRLGTHDRCQGAWRHFQCAVAADMHLAGTQPFLPAVATFNPALNHAHHASAAGATAATGTDDAKAVATTETRFHPVAPRFRGPVPGTSTGGPCHATRSCGHQLAFGARRAVVAARPGGGRQVNAHAHHCR